MIIIADNIKKILLRIISLVMLMEMLDATVLNTALPQIAISLKVNPIQLKEILTIYFLSLGIFISISGWAADRFGEKQTLIFAILLFTFSSIGCGLAFNLPMLIFFRCLQGIGGAFLVPVGRQIMIRVFSGMERIHAMSKVNIMTFLGLSLGPLVGGALTTYLNWRWIFFINIPVGITSAYYVFNYLPAFREKQNTKFDFFGFIFIGIFLGSLLFLLDILIDARISYQEKLLLLLVSFCSFFIYIQYAKRASNPLISLKLFQQGNFKTIVMSSFFCRLTITALPFLIPLLLQAGYGYSAMKSGILTIPSIGGNLASVFLIPFLAKYLYNFKFLILNTVLMLIIACSFYFQAIELLLPLLIVQQFLFGFFTPIQMNILNNQAYDSLSEAYLSSGTSVYSGIIQVSGSFGIALAALCMIKVMGFNDLEHHIPLIAFKVVFLVQSIYMIFALLLLFLKLRNNFSEITSNSKR